MHRRLTFCTIATTALLLGSSAAAQPPASGVPATGSPVIDDNARYAWIDAQLAQIEGPTERWFTGWTWTFAWLAAGQAGLAAAAPKPGQVADSAVGAVTSALGLGTMLIAPNTLLGAREQLAKFDATMPQGQYERRRRAEYVLQAVSAEERFQHSWVPHVLHTLANAGGWAVLFFGYKEYLAAWATLGAGFVVGEIQIFTRPWSATNAWEQYVKDYHPIPASQVPPDQIHLSFSVTPFGAAAQGTF